MLPSRSVAVPTMACCRQTPPLTKARAAVRWSISTDRWWNQHGDLCAHRSVQRTGFAIPSNRVGAFVSRWFESTGLTPRALPNAPGQPPAVGAAVAQPPAVQQPAARPGAGWLGLGLVDVTPEMATQLQYPFPGGAFVASVILDSPADEAEFVRGDVVVSMAGQPVTDVETVGRIMAGLSPGQTVPVTIWRNGKTSAVNMRLRGGG